MADKAREAALAALGRCRRDGAYSAAAIDGAVKKYALESRDAAFLTRLVLGVEENAALCDYYIGLYSTEPTARLEPKVLDILRLGVCQLLFLDKVPPSAAVNTGVELCRAAGVGRASGLVNAVLRRVAENRGRLPDVPGRGTAQYLAVKYSHPLWLAEKLTADHGYAFTEAFFAADNRPSPLDVQVNTLKTTATALAARFAEAGVTCAPHPLLPDCLRLAASGAVTALPGFDEGLFYVQSAAARWCVSAAELRPGMTVLDACAAPGGKSFAAAMDMKDRGVVVARDIKEKKIRLIESGAARLGISIIRAAAMDAREKTAEVYDAVLADVPCSGLGVIGGKPEIRNRAPEDIAGLPAIQLEILRALADKVRCGGVLLYSTCTVLKEENEDVIAAFLAERPDYQAELTRGFWPQTDETDGFFVCRLRKRN